jgi:hypothetical protein
VVAERVAECGVAFPRHVLVSGTNLHERMDFPVPGMDRHFVVDIDLAVETDIVDGMLLVVERDQFEVVRRDYWDDDDSYFGFEGRIGQGVDLRYPVIVPEYVDIHP